MSEPPTSPLFGYTGDGRAITKDYIAEVYAHPLDLPDLAETRSTRSQRVPLHPGLDANHRDRRHSSTDNNLLESEDDSGSNNSVVTTFQH